MRDLGLAGPGTQLPPAWGQAGARGSGSVIPRVGCHGHVEVGQGPSSRQVYSLQHRVPPPCPVDPTWLTSAPQTWEDPVGGPSRQSSACLGPGGLCTSYSGEGGGQGLASETAGAWRAWWQPYSQLPQSGSKPHLQVLGAPLPAPGGTRLWPSAGGGDQHPGSPCWELCCLSHPSLPEGPGHL